VRACPTNARHFGDFSDPNSNVSKMTKARSGMELMPELQARPVNRYLPPRLTDHSDSASFPDILTPMINKVPKDLKGFLGWVDKALDKM
jgi:hypothetical protein